MKKQNIEDIFSSMEDFSSVPPPELWGEIEKKLDKPKKKKRVILWWSAAACLLLGLLIPSVFHFTSTSGIKTIDKGSIENNSVVLDEKKNEINTNTTISTQENTPEEITTQKSGTINEVSSQKNSANSASNSPKIQNQKTTVAHSDSTKSKNPDVLNSKSNLEKTNANQAVAEKTFVPDQKNGFNSESKNQIANTDKKASNPVLSEKALVSGKTDSFNSSAKNQIANTDKKASNPVLSEKALVSGKTDSFNSNSKNQIANVDKKASNPVLSEKAFVTGKTDSFNSNSKNQIANADKKVTNQTLVEKTFITGKSNGFNSAASKNQIANADKKATDKILAEKTFAAGKTNPFNPTSKNQLSKSPFEDQSTSKNKNNFAYNPAANVNSNQNAFYENQARLNNSGLSPEKQVASNQKNNSKFNTVLNKQDSVQLAELQNLEKGISPEEKKESKNKLDSNAEKWAVEVFAGVASSENYKNEKTLGNTNDSRQSNSYGVKTKYKINKKWAVASGLKINELGQSVANVSYLSAKNNAFFSTSDYLNQSAAAAVAPQITANDAYIFVPTATTEALRVNGVENKSIENGNLDQNLRYIEMPLEVSYALFSMNRASINLNTGGFVGKLISNNVALDGSSIGENVNANDYVYGSTLSSTLQYRVYKKTNVFVEPAMNYYINPLNNQSFNQFQWGLNFGLNVSF